MDLDRFLLRVIPFLSNDRAEARDERTEQANSPELKLRWADVQCLKGWALGCECGDPDEAKRMAAVGERLENVPRTPQGRKGEFALVLGTDLSVEPAFSTLESEPARVRMVFSVPGQPREVRAVLRVHLCDKEQLGVVTSDLLRGSDGGGASTSLSSSA